MYSPRSASSISSLRIGRAGGTWAGMGMVPGVTFGIRTSAPCSGRSPLEGIDDQASQGLRVEIGRLLRHDVALGRDREHIPNGRGLQEEGRVGAVGSAVHPVERLADRLRVVDALAGCQVGGGDAGELLECDTKQAHVEVSNSFATGGQPAAEHRAARFQERSSFTSPQPEAPATTGTQTLPAERRQQLTACRGSDVEQRSRALEEAGTWRLTCEG